jgi:hypothetical protein
MFYLHVEGGGSRQTVLIGRNVVHQDIGCFIISGTRNKNKLNAADGFRTEIIPMENLRFATTRRRSFRVLLLTYASYTGAASTRKDKHGTH